MRLLDTRITVLAAGRPGEYTNVINAYAQPHGKGQTAPIFDGTEHRDRRTNIQGS
jgi:hypothetical protein